MFRSSIGRQPLGQHREDLGRGVDGRRVGAGVAVDRAALRDRRVHVGHGHEQLHRPSGEGLGHRELVEVARVVVVDRRPRAVPQVADGGPRLQDALAEGACCSIVGLSNIGKSMLLRTAAEESSAKGLNVYVDCNLMPALTDQSFYEVTLRAALDAVKRLGKKAPLEVVNRLEELCRQVIAAERPIVPALSFNDGISLLCEQLDRRVALLFDLSVSKVCKAIRRGAIGPMDVLSDTMGVDFGPYLQRVLRDVKLNWYNLIPEAARPPLMKRGKVSIEFAIMKDGRVQGLTLTGTSGDVSLDRAAWGGITASNPFPPLPAEFRGDYLALRFHFYYNPDNPNDLN